jgi:hypothetical protein
MNVIRYTFIALAAVASCGCAHTVASLQPDPSANVTYVGGVPSVVSRSASTSVAIMPANADFEVGERISLTVAVLNSSGQPFDFDVSNISASDGNKPVRVYTYDQVAKEIRHSAAVAAFGAAMGAAGRGMQAANAGTTTAYSNGTMQAHNNTGGYATGNYQGSTTTYNPAAVATAQAQSNAQTQADMQRITAARQSAMGEAGGIIRRTTVQPGATYIATAMVDAPKADPKSLNLRVVIGADVHEFHFNYTTHAQ